jgi:hypothetical protein
VYIGISKCIYESSYEWKAMHMMNADVRNGVKYRHTSPVPAVRISQGSGDI